MAAVDSSVPNGHSGANGAELTAAQKLAQTHAHNATIEDVPDEEDLKHGEQPVSASVLEASGDENAPGWVPPISTKAAGKRKEEPVKDSKIDIQSAELFPSLGQPKSQAPAATKPLWAARQSSNGTNGISSDGVSTPASGVSTPRTVQADPRKINIPGQVREDYILQKDQILPRQQLKKPLPDILKDINKKSKKVNVTHSIGQNGHTFSAVGPSLEAVRQSLRDVVSQVGAKVTDKVSIPQSARAHIIGKQGSKIKELQERTGARIQIPKIEETPRPTDDDDDPMIDILVEGNAQSVGAAQDEILRIAGERTATVNTKLRTIPAEFYPFISGNVLEGNGVQAHVPPYSTWRSQPPPQKAPAGQQPVFLPAADDNHITLAGDRAAVQAMKLKIEQLAEDLRRQLIVEQFHVNKARHQFIIGNRGMSPEEFFSETGCAIILPGGEVDDEMIALVGPPSQILAAKKKALSQVAQMQQSTVDLSRILRNAPDAGSHIRNLTQYLRQRKAIEELENQHQAQIFADVSQSGGAAPWEVFSRDYENLSNAQSEIASIVNAHPPSRMSTIPVDPFFHQYLQKEAAPRVKKDFGVHVVLPHPSEVDGPVLLVFEGETGIDSGYQVPRDQPSPDQIGAFKQGLQDARRHILEIINAQAEIISTSIEVPRIFHEKLRRYIRSEQLERAADQIPVRVSQSGEIVTLRGPKPAVESLAAKVVAFVEQATQDEKERGFTLSFDFPQKHANQLIGKGGSNIRELRDRFDVEIKVDDGKVELKGPKAKAEAAKSHISNLGRQWADETTYILKIDPKYHRELIGQQGKEINKLQTKYKVQINFPRSARPTKEDQSNVDASSEAGRRGPRREQAPDEVIVKGPKKGADEAKGEILDLVQYYTDIGNVATISVQQSQIPSLIGQGGKAMDELRSITGARIDVPNAKDVKDPSGKVEIQIKGTKSQVAQAKKLLEEKKTIFDHTVSKTLEVDKKHHRALIGAGGSNLRKIVVDAGGSDNGRDLARTIQFPKAESDGNIIKIEGNKDVVEKIIAAIQEIISERDSQTTETIDVPTDKHRSLIGRGGETKKALESKFTVSIDIPRQGNGQTGVKIVGLPANVEKAKVHILDLIKDQEGETVQVPRKVHHSIADNGQFFRKLRSNHQITVDHAGHKIPEKPAAPSNARTNGGSLPLITDDAEAAADAFSWNVITADSNIDGDIPWVLRGPPDNVAKAKETLTAAIEQALKSTSTGYLVLPDPTTYRYVIGPGGSKVNSIRETTGCKITVPHNKAKDEAIEISGSAEGIEKAKEMVLQFVKEGSNANGNRS